MANARNSNTWFVDTTGDLDQANASVKAVVVTATSASAVLVLSDAASSNAAKKLEIRVAATSTTQVIDLSASPVTFPNGIRITTLTNCVATLVL